MIRCGTSGWYYDDWSGDFFPDDIPRKNWLEYYSHHFDTVEVNASFYRLPTSRMMKSWYRRTPDDFLFVMKGSRLITHSKKLKNVREPVRKFFDRISMVQEKIGAVLWQVPERIERDTSLLKEFIDSLDHDYDNVVEFRHESWYAEEVFDLMSDHEVSLCIVDCPDIHSLMKVTSEPAYIRFHGKEHWYDHDYTDSELGGWLSRIRRLDASNIFCFFNNDQGGYAPWNCLSLKRMLESD